MKLLASLLAGVALGFAGHAASGVRSENALVFPFTTSREPAWAKRLERKVDVSNRRAGRVDRRTLQIQLETSRSLQLLCQHVVAQGCIAGGEERP